MKKVRTGFRLSAGRELCFTIFQTPGGVTAALTAGSPPTGPHRGILLGRRKWAIVFNHVKDSMQVLEKCLEEGTAKDMMDPTTIHRLRCDSDKSVTFAEIFGYQHKPRFRLVQCHKSDSAPRPLSHGRARMVFCNNLEDMWQLAKAIKKLSNTLAQYEADEAGKKSGVVTSPQWPLRAK